MSKGAVARFAAFLRISKGRRYASLLASLLGATSALLLAGPAQAQTPPKPTFCAGTIGCFDTMEKAADAIRNSEDYQGIGQYLKAYKKSFLATGQAGQVWTYFQVPFQKAVSVANPSFGVSMGIYGNGNPGCAVSPEFGERWCVDEGALIAKSLEILTARIGNSCALKSNVQASDYNTTKLTLLSDGVVNYNQDKYFNATFNCLSNAGAPVTRTSAGMFTRSAS